MPVYTYRCPDCRTRSDIFKPLADLNREEYCPDCLTPRQRLISAPAVHGDYAAYNCPVTGQLIEGRRAHEENLKKHGCRVLEAGETAQARRAAAREESDLDRSVDSTVEQFYEALPTEKREQLAVAVQSGLDVSITRS